MSRYGLGFGAQAAARPSRGGSPADGAAVLAPGAGWTGVAGSGFGGSPPADPERLTAKPALRLATPPKQAFTSTQLVGVIGGANDDGTLIDNLGIEKVIVHFEGASIDIDAPNLRSFTDANGQTVRYFGWWAILQKPAGLSGNAEIYFEAVPRDATMQNRVIGPFTYFPVDQLYDIELQVAPSEPEVAGASYRTLQDALGYLRSQSASRPRITVVEAGDYDLEGSNFPYEFEGWCEVTASVPITITRPAPDAGESFRPRRGPIRFRGSNITIDFVRASELHTEPGHEPFWCDGVNLTNSAGRDSLRFKAPRNLLTHLIRDFGWMTECTVTNLWSAGARCQLVRGCRFSNTWGDVFTGSQAVLDCIVTDHDGAWYRDYVDAFDASYAGQGAATLEMSGGNGADNRTLTAKVDGSVAGAFTVRTGKPEFDANTHFSVGNVVAWLNSLPDWSASVINDDRRAADLQADGTIGAWGPISITGSPTVIPTFMDVHADMFQTTGENIVIAGNVGTGINAQVFFMANFDSRDFLMVNNAFDNVPPVGDKSQFQESQSHVVFAHNVLSTQDLLIGNGAYDPDSYCLIANNAIAALDYAGDVDSDLVMAFNHLGSGAIAPDGAVGTTIGGSAVGNFGDAVHGDFTPQGALLAYPKPPTIRFDKAGNARRSPVAPVGAIRGPVGSDVIAPEITSADPSGSYIEGGLIDGQLTASEPVTWLVSGQDAPLVALNPNTGVWSVGPTEYDFQSSYAFTFEAIDAAGNGSSQPVAIAIVRDAGDGPFLSSFADSANGFSGANLTVDTDTGDGVLYWAITGDGSTPDAAMIKAGLGFSASGSQAVSSVGPQTIAVAGLAASTSYVAHVVQTSAAGTDSLVESGDGFMTAPAGPQADAIIIIVAGQSNARKASTDPAAAPSRYTTLSDVHQWIASTGTPSPYVAGANSGHRGAEGEWGTEAERIYQLRQDGETRPIYVVKEAVNGNALASVGSGDWLPDNSGERFEGLENQVADLRTWLETNTAHTSFDEETLWNQGEADANDDATAEAYAANWAYFLAQYRSRISDGFFVAERIRPLGYEGASIVDNIAGFARAYKVREAVLAGILADGNGGVIDTDFDTGNFTQIHPQEPNPWNADSWTTQIGLRAHALRSGSYNATYGDITDAVPDAFTIPPSSGEEAEVVASTSIAISGIERRAAVTLASGVEMRILNRNGSLHTDWTSDDSGLFIDKFQTFALRAAAPAHGVSNTHTVTIGGVAADWQLSGTGVTNYRADTQAWLDALSLAGGASLSVAQEEALDAFYQTGEDDGWMAKVQTMALALGGEIAARIDLKSPANTYVQDGGTPLPWNAAGQYWLADANNQRLSSTISPSAVTTQNGVGVGAWVKVLGDSTAFLMGSGDGSVGFRLRSSGSMRAALHSGNVNFNGLTISTAGFYMANRIAAADSRVYGPTGTELGSSTVPSFTPTATSLRIGQQGTTDKESGVGGIWLTEGMAAADVQNMRNAMVALMAAF